MKKFANAAGFLALAFLLTYATIASAGEYDGTWTLLDSDGKPFTAILNPDGSASGTHGDAMKYGHWAVENGAAVIHWKTGWTTRIAKEQGKYMKSAFKPGADTSGSPTSHSKAEKVQ